MAGEGDVCPSGQEDAPRPADAEQDEGDAPEQIMLESLLTVRGPYNKIPVAIWPPPELIEERPFFKLAFKGFLLQIVQGNASRTNLRYTKVIDVVKNAIKVARGKANEPTEEERAALMLGTGRKRKHTPVHAMPAIVQIDVPVHLNGDAGGDVETIQLSAASAMKPVRLEATVEVLSWLVTAVNSEERKKEVEAPSPISAPQPKQITFRSRESCFSIRYPSGYFHRLDVPTTDGKGNPLGDKYKIVVQEYLERAKKILIAHGGVVEDAPKAPTAVHVASSESSQAASEPSSQPSPSSLAGPLDLDEFGAD